MNLNKAAVILFLGLGLTARLASAQQPTPVGVITAETGATVGNANVTEGATVFSGDLLKTGDQGRLNVQCGTIQFAMGENSSIRLFRNGNRTIVEIERGTLAYSFKGGAEDLALFALDIRIVPKTNVSAAGQVSIISRCDVHVTAIHSTIEVTSGRETRTIEETKSFRVLSDSGVDYRDSWQPVLADYPDYPRDALYHRSHSHVACPAGVWRAPVVAAAKSHFGEVVGVIGGIITGPVVHEAFESPDRP